MYGTATAAVLRHTAGHHGTERGIVADLLFRSLKIAITLMKCGLYCNFTGKDPSQRLLKRVIEHN